jgi:hypothetical protein
LLDSARDLKESGNKKMASVYTGAAKALNKDIDDAIDFTPNDELKNAHTKAKMFYKNNVVPFNNPSIRNILFDKYNEKTIGKNLLKPENSSIIENMPENVKSKVLYNLLSSKLRPDEMNEVLSANPAPLLNQFDKLTPAEKERLVSPALQKHFDLMRSLSEITKEPLKQLSHAYTGGRNWRTLATAAFLSDIGRQVASGDLAGALHSAITIPVISRLASQKLIKPEVLQAMITGRQPLTEAEALSNITSGLPSSILKGITQYSGTALPRYGARLTTETEKKRGSK